MRYEQVHLDNVNPAIDPLDLELVEECVGSVFHIGCLTGKLIAEIKQEKNVDVAGAENYSLAPPYGRKRGVDVYEQTSQVQTSFDTVIIDPDYQPERFVELLEEASRIAAVKIIYGVRHEESIPESYDDYSTYIINDKYAALTLED